MAAKRPSLDEAIDRSVRTLNVAGFRENVEARLASQDRLAKTCELATTSLLEMFGRDDLVKERIAGAGGDYFALLDQEGPKADALRDALERYRSDTSSAWGAWKRACMRVRPGED